MNIPADAAAHVIDNGSIIVIRPGDSLVLVSKRTLTDNQVVEMQSKIERFLPWR